MRLRRILTVGCVAALGVALLATPAHVAGATPGSGHLTNRLAAVAADQPHSTSSLAASAAHAGLPQSGPGSLMRGPGVTVEVNIRVSTISTQVQQALTAAGAQITIESAEASTFVGYVAPLDLQAVAAVPGVVLVSEILAPISSSASGGALAPRAAKAAQAACAPTTSLADTQLKAAIARAGAGVNGAGIKVGVMSSSYNRDASAATTPAQDVASGNLPGIGNPCGFTTPVQVLADNLPQADGPTDEGRGMLQLIHKVAPGATLMFATGLVGGQLGTADNIRALQAAGANVIVDDLVWTEEPMFQDGIVYKAIADVTALGTTYLSSAGNLNAIVNGRDVSSIEVPTFAMTSCPGPVAAEPGVPADSCLDFAPSSTSNTAWYTIAAGGVLVFPMNYSEPLFGVTDDINLYLLDAGETTILNMSTNSNISPGGTGTPFQVVWYQNTSSAPITVKLAMSRVAGSGTPRTKVLVFELGPGLTDAQYTTSSESMTIGPTIFGHMGGANALSVAATSGSGPGTTPEDFSSRGPVTHYWGPFTTASTPASAIPAQVILKPDFTATDRDCTTFLGRPEPNSSCPYVFGGTSAAAPNAAGVAALVLSQNPKLTPAQVGARLASTATPMSGGSVESTGAGLLNAFAALGSPTPVQAQVPVKGCVLMPRVIPRRGQRQLERRHCLTNAGRSVRVTVTGGPVNRGDMSYWKLIRTKNGAVFIRTFGYRLKLRITWSAPATNGYTAYRLVQTYHS